MDDLYGEKTLNRFLSKIEKNEKGCWLWTSTLNNKGYARLNVSRKQVLMHRWAYIYYRGDIPEGLELDHLCHTPRCVNPDHLEPVTHHENVLRGNSVSALHAKVTHCPQGHPYDEENTHIGKNGGRNCRTCGREKARPYHKMLIAMRTHCPQGHPYDTENTGINKNGRRYCKECYRVTTPPYKRNMAQKRRESLHD